MEDLRAYFAGFGKTVFSIIGSGGKTSLLWCLADSVRGEKTLATTTTRMMLPDAAEGLYDRLLFASDYPPDFRPLTGVTMAGTKTPEGKFRSLEPAALAALIPMFDYVFIEADGSRTLPVKAWADYEPVVPPYTGVTIGILPVWPLGLPVSGAIIHRPELFTALTGAKEGGPLVPEHLARVIDSGGGLFKAACGKRILFFNQVEDDETSEKARAVLTACNKDFLRGLDGIIAGSVRKKQIIRLPLP